MNFYSSDLFANFIMCLGGGTENCKNYFMFASPENIAGGFVFYKICLALQSTLSAFATTSLTFISVDD